MIDIFRHWLIALKDFAGRFARLAMALVKGKFRVTADDREDVIRLKAETGNQAPLDINHQDPPLEHNPVYAGYPVSSVVVALRSETHQDIDATGFSSLEGYAEGLSVSEETIAKWVNAGILSPQETEVAEKVIRIMRTKIGGSGSPRSLSSPDPSPPRRE